MSAHSQSPDKNKFKKEEIVVEGDVDHLNDLVGGNHQDSKEEIKENEKPKIIKKKVWKCGLEWRWHPQQVIAWIILIVDFLVEIFIMSWYYAFLSHWAYTLVNLFVYIFFSILIAISGCYATSIDSTDENIRF